MPRLSQACLAIYIWVSVAAADDVLVLGGDNFKDLVLSKDLIAVEFYAPWCGHCKQLEPEWRAAASKLKARDPPIYLGKVDATAAGNRKIASMYGVQGYPTIKLFRKGNIGDYNGPRKAAGIVEYLEEQSLPATVEIEAKGDIASYLAQGKMMCLGFFEKGSAEEAAFVEAAGLLRGDELAKFALAADGSPAYGEFKVTSPAVVLVRDSQWRAQDQVGALFRAGARAR